jgi:D-amino-acid dehydrogenase
MAAGTGRVMADLISGRTPEISMEGLTVARYGRATHRATANPITARQSLGSR